MVLATARTYAPDISVNPVTLEQISVTVVW